jgi:hypothetical protein
MKSVLWVNKGRVRLNFAELHKDDEAEEITEFYGFLRHYLRILQERQ